jgi:rod shape-determining protein MreC
MSQLLRLILRARNLLLFILLEIFSFWLIVKNNNYWDVSFFNTSNYYAAKTLDASNYVKNYMNLGINNKQLAIENAELKKSIAFFEQLNARKGDYYKADSIMASRFSFKVAKVVNSTVNLANNYLTIDKGSLDGIEPGMGIISPTGVVGSVKSCSEHFSVVFSILHTDMKVSSEIKNFKNIKEPVLGIGQWGGLSPKLIQMTTIDRFKPVKQGDSVVTSNQNAVFPPGIMVGKVKKLNAKQDQAFFEMDVELSTDFRNLTFVYIVNNKLQQEQNKLEAATAR